MKKIKNWLFVILALTMVLTGCQKEVSLPTDIAVTTAPKAEEVVADPTTELQVHFLDVGQGDSILLKQGTHSMLIDGGDVDYGNKVVSYLRSQNIETLELLTATHPHADHIGGLPAVIKNITVSKIWLPDVIHVTKTNENFIAAIEKAQVETKIPEPGDEFMLGDAKITVLSPKRQEYENTNNYSIVLRVVYGKTSFLFMGDAQREVENELLASDFSLKSDVLKVGHHGSGSSSTAGFLDTVSPSIAVISVGENNTYDHPDNSVVKRLDARNITTFRTDKNGTVIVTSDGKKINVTVERDK